MNEELQTINAELKNKLEEISRAHSDLENLMAATDVAIRFLDRSLRIQRYTPRTSGLFNIMSGDRGRPIAHLTHHMDYDKLERDAQHVLGTLQTIEREVRATVAGSAGAGNDEQEWFLVRVRPYRTVEDHIDGVVITFVDITHIKEAEQALEYSRERNRLMVEGTIEYAMFTMDENGAIDTWNRGARRILGYDEAEIMAQPGDIIFTPEDRAAGVVEEELALARKKGSAASERWHLRKDGSRFWGSGVVTALYDGQQLRGYAKVMRDNTSRKEAEESLQRSKEALQTLNETLEQKVRERTESLKQRSDEVRELAEQMTIAEQEERSRIAQVLHADISLETEPGNGTRVTIVAPLER